MHSTVSAPSLLSRALQSSVGAEWLKMVKILQNDWACFFPWAVNSPADKLDFCFSNPGDCSEAVSHWELLKSLGIKEEILV